MNIEDVRNHCLSKKGVTESFPFDEDTLVFKVCNKMFLLVSLSENRINVKCDPDKAIELREQYSAVTPGFHMNKALWNTVVLNDTIPPKLIAEWIDDSYKLVVGKLTKKEQAGLL